MRRVVQLFVVGMLLFVPKLYVYGQNETEDAGFLIPEKYISVLIVPDRDCPVQILRLASIRGFRNGAIQFGYTLRNTSNANVESFEIGQLNWMNTQGLHVKFGVGQGELFSPLMTYSTLTGFDESILPTVDEKSAKQFGINGPQNRVWIIMVTRAKLSDGTSYDASKQFRAVEEFLSSLVEPTTGMTEQESSAREEKVRAFVLDLLKPVDVKQMEN